MLSIFQCTAVVVVDSNYRTNTCCLLYRETIVLVTGTGTGNQTVYYKPRTKLEPGEPDVGTTTGNYYFGFYAVIYYKSQIKVILFNKENRRT